MNKSETIGREERIQWMAVWCAKNNLKLELAGSCGIGRDCVGVTTEGKYPDYHWYDETTYERIDQNRKVWVPKNAYHKHDCVAVLGHGEDAEKELYDWLRWFDANGFKLEIGNQDFDRSLGAIAIIMGKHRYARMVKQK